MKNTHQYFCQAPSHQFIFFERGPERVENFSPSPLSQELIQQLKKDGGLAIEVQNDKTTLRFEPSHVVEATANDGKKYEFLSGEKNQAIIIFHNGTEKIEPVFVKDMARTVILNITNTDGSHETIKFWTEKQPGQVEQAETSEERIPLNQIIKILDNGMNATQNLTIPAQLKTRFEAANRAGYILQMGDGKSGEMIIFNPSGGKIKSVFHIQTFNTGPWAEEILDAIEYHQKMDGMIK